MTFCPRVAVDAARYSVGAVHKRAGPETRRELALRSRESFGGKVTFRLTAGLTGFCTQRSITRIKRIWSVLLLLALLGLRVGPRGISTQTE